MLAGGVFAVAARRVRPRPGRGAAALARCRRCRRCCCRRAAARAAAAAGRVVVATTTQIGDWVRVVGGDAVDVHQILQPNTDPHEYEPRPADVEATSGAKVVFENGDDLDRVDGQGRLAGRRQPEVVVLGGPVPVRLAGERSGPEASKFDPHWWHDPRNAMAAVQQIRAALARRRGPRRATFAPQRGRVRRAAARARPRDRAPASRTVPRAERKLVTDHDAFGYFARRYGIKVVGAVIPSQTTAGAALGGRRSARLIALIRREHVKAIFPESSLNPALAQTIARETGARADYTLYGDTLGPKGSPGATYLTMERANADAMVARLHGRRAQLRDRGGSPTACSRPSASRPATAGRAGARRASRFELEPGERIARARPERRRQDDALPRSCSASCGRSRARSTARGRCGFVPQTERSRLDFPVTALDVALMGTLSRLPWWRPTGRRGARAARDGARPRRPRDRRRTPVRRALGRPAPARARRPRARAGRADPAPRRALHRRRPAERGAARARCSHELAAEGRGIARSRRTTSSRRARWDRVLCLNRRQVAFGAAGGGAHARGARGDLRRRDRALPGDAASRSRSSAAPPP